MRAATSSGFAWRRAGLGRLPPPHSWVTVAGSMDEPTRIQVCGLIAGILSSDEDVNIHEAGFIRRVRQRFELAKGTRVPLIVDHDEAVAKLRGFSDEVRKETLELLIQAAAADGMIMPAERSFLDAIADALQVQRVELEDRLQEQLLMSKPQPFGLDPPSDNDH